MPETNPQGGVPTRLEQALAEYEHARDLGQTVDYHDLIARYPEVADELDRELAAKQRAAAAPRPAAESSIDSPIPFPILADYEILAELGRGGMGVVYKARQKGTEQLVALKMLHPHWLTMMDEAERGEAVEQFGREVRAAARLRHEHTIKILHMGEHEGRPYYAMQLVEGESLAQRLEHSGESLLEKQAVVRYVAEVAEAVQEAHDAGILHRDIKPHNMLIDRPTDRALIADFGLAQLRVDSVHGSQLSDSQRRAQAPIAGTLPYMAPEQTRSGGQASEASDVYSLGATLYQALTGSPPFIGRPGPELLAQIRNDPPVPLRQRDRTVSPDLERICLKCLAKEPSERYASAGDLARALRAYLSQTEAAGQVSAMGRYLIGLGPVVFLINLLAFVLLRWHYPEPLIWLVTFSMYPALYSVFLLAPNKKTGRTPQVTARDFWAPWGSKLFTAITIAIVLRVALAPDAERAILLSFPMFASLSGMAVFSSVIKVSWLGATVCALGCWCAALLMLIHLPIAPLIYGAYAMMGTVGLGVYLSRTGRALR